MRAARFLVLLGVAACASWRQGSTGTCFFVSSSGLALTSLHVVGQADRVFAVDATGRQFRAQIVARDERLDLAAMQAQGIDAPAILSIASRDPALAERVFAIGALASGPRTSEGAIVEQHALGTEYLLGTSAAVVRGNSGGPLIDETGAVVGIMTRRRDDDSGRPGKLSFAVRASSARTAFDALPAAAAPAPLDLPGAIARAHQASCLIVIR